MITGVIFKRVGDGRPYPDHGLDSRGWADLPPRQVRLDELVTTKDTLRLDTQCYAERWRGPANRPPGSPWSSRPHPESTGMASEGDGYHEP